MWSLDHIFPRCWIPGCNQRTGNYHWWQQHPVHLWCLFFASKKQALVHPIWHLDHNDRPIWSFHSPVHPYFRLNSPKHLVRRHFRLLVCVWMVCGVVFVFHLLQKEEDADQRRGKQREEIRGSMITYVRRKRLWIRGLWGKEDQEKESDEKLRSLRRKERKKELQLATNRTQGKKERNK